MVEEHEGTVAGYETHSGSIEINLDNLLCNARTIQHTVGGGVQLMPVLKANGYGLGARNVMVALQELDPPVWGYMVTTLQEGIALRRCAPHGTRIIVLTPARETQWRAYREHELIAVIDRMMPAAKWAHWQLPWHLEVDTGMSRCGIWWSDVAAISLCLAYEPQGIFTHLSHAHERDIDIINEQFIRLDQAARYNPSHTPEHIHIAGSAGVWRFKHRYTPPCTLVRPGIFLYGGSPAPDILAPEEVITIRAPVVSVRKVQADTPVGYGATWCAPYECWIATLGIGYADGLSSYTVRHSESYALLNGLPCYYVGRCTMDYVMVATATNARPSVGDLATIIGSEARQTITLDTFAQWAGTVPDEVLTGFGNGLRLRKKYTMKGRVWS